MQSMIHTLITTYSNLGLAITGIWLPGELFEQLRLELMSGQFTSANDNQEKTTLFKSPNKVAEVMGVKIYESTDRQEMKVLSTRLDPI